MSGAEKILEAAERIVVTGVGLISSIATGREQLAEQLCSGASGEKAITIFEPPDARAATACQVEPFDYRAILGDIKSRYLDRSTLLALAAMKLALDDGAVGEAELADFGVVLGSAFGSLWSAGDYTREALAKGPAGGNPMKFPNTVMNSPASQVNIRYGLKTLSSTITTGFTASLDALAYAMNHLEMGHGDRLAVGGVEELCPDAFRGYHLSGCLSGRGQAMPLDRGSGGCMLGEGATILLLERESSAHARGARILAEVGGYGSSFEPCLPGQVCRGHAGIRKAMQNALASAGMRLEEIDLVSAAANGAAVIDRRELAAIRELVEGSGFEGHITSIKGRVGECYGATGALQMAAAVGSLLDGRVAGVRKGEGSWEPSLDRFIPPATVGEGVSSVLVNNISPYGNSTSVVLRRHGWKRA